jgi:hypothetical protein
MEDRANFWPKSLVTKEGEEMNKLKRLMAVLLVGGAGFGLFVACGGEETSCTFDADCSDGQACEGTVCVDTCTADSDCGPGEVCGAGVNTELNVCKADSTTTNNITPNNVDPNNVTPNNAVVYYAVRIQSTSAGDDSCANTDPGPDIFGVGLEDSTGAQLGWGVVDWEEITFDGNDHTDTSIIDGNGPDLGADNCPDMFDGNVVSLGCDATSFLIVSFVDSSSQPIPLDATADQVIRVYEWGGQCSTGSIDDTYNVDICTDTMAARSGEDASCTLQVIIDGAGEASGDVGF